MAPVDDGRISSIIFPPPEVRNIVDKTASFVARNGATFENRIKENEVNNPKFNFLTQGDPYHAYYQYKVSEFRDGKAAAESIDPKLVTAPPPPPPPLSLAKNEVVKQRQSELLKQVQKEQEPPPPKDPPPEFEFVADPPSISAFDLDVVKLTAQFVARNGRQFLTNLMNREQRNYQFDFLRPQHALFQYFTKLLEQYTKVLIPPKDLLRKLEEESKNEKVVRDQVRYRVSWARHQEAIKRQEEEAAERERISYAQIDWHGFVVVETVDYQPWEVGNFPPPTNPTEVGARVLIQRRSETVPTPARPKEKDERQKSEGANLEIEDMEEGSSDEYESEEDDVSQAPQAIGKPVVAVDAAPMVMQPPSLPVPGKVEVRKYDPKQALATRKKPEAEEYLVSPITGEKIPASKVQDHMRIGLLDPRWVEERDKQITARASEEHVFAPGQAIESSLKHLAERRTDIFGVGDEAAQEAEIGQKMGEEERRSQGDKLQWDGHSSTADAASRAARTNVTLMEQIEQIHRSKGLIPDNSKDGIGPKVGSGPPAQMVPAPQVRAPVPPPTIRAAAAPMTPAVQAVVGMMPIRPAQAMIVTPQPFFLPTQSGAMLNAAFPGLAPPAMVPRPPLPPMPDSGEPSAKRMRGEESLMPEADFLARNPPVVTVKVSVATVSDKPEWKLNGQTLTFNMNLRDTIATLKSNLFEELTLPPGKQKLQLENMFLKDSNSLAFYNVTANNTIALQLKERGGRKK